MYIISFLLFLLNINIYLENRSCFLHTSNLTNSQPFEKKCQKISRVVDSHCTSTIAIYYYSQSARKLVGLLILSCHGRQACRRLSRAGWLVTPARRLSAIQARASICLKVSEGQGPRNFWTCTISLILIPFSLFSLPTLSHPAFCPTRSLLHHSPTPSFLSPFSLFHPSP